MEIEIDKDEVFIRADLNRTSGGGTAYFRLSKELRDFLNLCDEKSEIEGIILTRENGDYHKNIGFVLKDKEFKQLNNK